MKRPLVVGPIAEREVEAAARWYEARELSLGRAFVDEVLRAFDAVEAEPEIYPVLRARIIASSSIAFRTS